MHTSFNNFIESTSKTLEHHTENPNDKYEVRPCDEPGTPFAVWEGDLRVKCFKTEEEAQAYADSENERQGLDEGTMSDIHQLAGEVKDLAEFTKEFFKRFGDKIKKTADSVEWVKTLYSDMANESIDEISQNEGIFDRFRKRSIKGTVDKEPYYFDIADKALLYLQKQDKEWRKYKLASVGPGDKKTHIRMALSHKTNHKTAEPEFMVYHDKNNNIEKVVELEFNYESVVNEAKGFKIGDKVEITKFIQDAENDETGDLYDINPGVKVEITDIDGKHSYQFKYLDKLPNERYWALRKEFKANVIKESTVTEGKKVTLKRRYTENHPAITAGKHAKIRNKVLEFIKDGRITADAFENFVASLSNNSKRWARNNSKYFTVSEEGVSLSKFGQRILKSITVNEKTENNPEIWVPGGFDKQIGKYPNSKITREIVLKAAKKWDVDEDDAIAYVEYGWDLDLNENNTNMKSQFIYESFSEFVNSLNESTESLNEAFASQKLASLLTGGAHMDKDLPKAFYQMSKLKLDQIQDVDIIEMDPLSAKKEKRANAVYFYFTTNEKENPYAGKSAWRDERQIPANTLLAITNGTNEWMATAWQRSYSRDKNATRTLKVTKRDDGAGFKKSSRGEYNSGISSLKQVAELADRAYVLDLDILKARYSATAQRDERAAAKKGAIAFKNDKDFKAENLARYNEIIANKASKLPIDKIVKDAIDTMSEQIKDALVKGEKGRYGDIIVGTSDKGREAKLRDAASHMQNILDDYQRYVNYVKQAEEEEKAGYGSSYYSREVKNYAKNVTDKVKQIEGFSYAW